MKNTCCPCRWSLRCRGWSLRCRGWGRNRWSLRCRGWGRNRQSYLRGTGDRGRNRQSYYLRGTGDRGRSLCGTIVSVRGNELRLELENIVIFVHRDSVHSSTGTIRPLS
eukprot:g17519.t1